MNIIEKVEIKNFRSFGNRKGETTKLDKVGALNILSGSNDSGKSNILRALNLFFNANTDMDQFFNFQRDFFKKEKLDDNDIKEAIVTIKIWFRNENNKLKNKKNDKRVFLPESFWVSKKWKKTSVYSQCATKSNIEVSFKHEKEGGTYEYFLDDKKDLKSMIKASLQKQLTEYLGQIQFHYIPAIKDKHYFSHLFGELQQTLWKAKRSVIDRKKTDFESEIQKETALLMREFKDTLGVKSLNYEPVFQLPENMVDLFKTLEVQTGNVELTQRGDGVQAKLIPEILNYIAIKEKSFTSRTVRKDVQSKKFFIWGFEEPENSYEYKNAQLLANRFRDKFIQNAQIFITTHSFNFLSVDGENITKYRVWQDDVISSSRISRIEKSRDGVYQADDLQLSNSHKLNEELGAFTLNLELEKIFLETERVKEQLETKLRTLEKDTSYLFVEDKYDQIYKIAWLKLNSFNFTLETLESTFEEKCDFSILGLEGAGAVSGLLRSKNTKIFETSKIVGLFDFDKEGSENFHHLKKDKYWGNEVLGSKDNGFHRKRTDHNCFYGMLLPVPSRLEILADLSHANFSSFVEIENLLPEGFLTQERLVTEQSLLGTKYYKIKDTCKDTLWKNLIELESDFFTDFKPLFDTFNKLTSSPHE